MSILALCLLLGGCQTQNSLNYARDARPGVNSVVTRSISNGDENPLLTEVNASEGAEMLAQFSTEFKNPKKSRAHNITLAARSIDEAIVNPGEEFSFNDAVGPTTRKRGFKLGMIFNRGQKSQGYGGGVCQVSSTLYNAALEANMEITERHEHSLEVGYIEKGRDAATSYGVKDLKFVNPHDFPVRINAYVINEKIITEIHKNYT